MGNSQNQETNKNQEISFFTNKYNWIPSFPMKEYDTITTKNIAKYIGNSYELSKTYVDLRVDCPPVLNIGDLPLHPISTVASMLNYQLNKNNLPLFPPSRLFIYKNCGFYPEINSVISYEMIFKSIEKFGFCSEVDYPYMEENIHQMPSLHHYKIAESFKFVDIFKIENDIKLLKLFLQNDKPLMIGIVLYNDLIKIIDKLWIPDLSIDKRIGGITGLIVGYSDERECFIVKMSFGKSFGNSGYIMIPYNYVNDLELVPEIYYIDLKKNRIEGFINQKRDVISLNESNKNIKKYNDNTSYNSIFN
jgi:hypothetical protein